MIDEIPKNAPLSTYQASAEVQAFTNDVKKDYNRGVEILNRPFRELNDRSVIDDLNRGSMMFEAFVDTEVEDPAEAWKWRGTRSMARNKGIAMVANLTSNYLLPTFTAQNEDDEVDVGFSEVMRDIIEWMAMPTNSNYQSSFLQLVFGMIKNPVTYMGAEFCEVFQTIREKQADGSYTKKEILDEVLSGFQAPVWSANQVLILNAYERNIQKQRRIIKRRYVEKSELAAKYYDHPNWEFVTEGVKSIYNEKDGLFYDVNDSEHPYLIAEETALSRRDDSEACFVNGIYMGDMDSIENNPIHHRDNRNAPKYNVVPFGFHRIGEHFYFYKSMMNSLGWDNSLYDTLSEIVMNRSILEVEMPMVVSGSDQIDTDVVFPNSVVTLEDASAKATPMLPASNLQAGFNALAATKDSIEDASLNDTASGALPDPNQKAFNVAQAQANTKKIISNVGKSLGESVVMYGDLMKDIAINNITAPQVDQLVGDDMRLKYRTFFLPDKSGKGKIVNKKIKFSTDLAYLDEGDKDNEEARLLEQSGYPETKDALLIVDPDQFARFKYLTRCDPEEIFTKNQDFWQPILLNLKAVLAADPYTNQEGLTRKIMHSYFGSEGDELVQKPQPAAPQQQNPNFPGDKSALGPGLSSKLSTNVASVIP